MPSTYIQGTHNTEDGFLRRLQEFRAINQEDETVLNYFDELEIHPEHIGIRCSYFAMKITFIFFSKLYYNIPM